jgi:hypothetical protein
LLVLLQQGLHLLLVLVPHLLDAFHPAHALQQLAHNHRL